jgi:hypothetical protein
MGIYNYTIPGLSFRPVIRVDPAAETLTVRTSRALRVLSLFLWWRTLVADRKSRRVTVRSRLFWVFSWTRDIPFERIDYVDTECVSTGTEYSFTWWRGVEATDEWDRFKTSLVLVDEDVVPLFSVIGPGAVESDWGDWFWADHKVVDTEGDQQQRSRSLAELLASFLGVRNGRFSRKPSEEFADPRE